MIFINETGTLTNEAVARWSQEAEEKYMEAAGKRATSPVKVRLAVEELLIKIRERQEDAEVHLIGRKYHGFMQIEFRYRGAPKDPIAVPPDEQVAYDILTRLDVEPRYKYAARRGTNFIALPLELKPVNNRTLIMMLAAVVFAVLCKLILGAASEGAVDFIYEGLTQPVFDKLIAVITALATPLVFLSVITGITGIGDASSFGKIGSKVIKGMAKTYIIAAAICGAICALAYPPVSDAAEESSNVLGQIVQLVLDIVPNNLVEPFTIDNDLQVITIAIFVGVVILILGNDLNTLNGILQDGSRLVNKMMAIVCSLLPLVVFLGIFNLLCTCDPKDFLSMYKVFILFIVICGLIMIYAVIHTRRVTKVPFKNIFRKMVPTLMINLATSSQVAALPESYRCLKERFGIDSKLVDFALPLGVVVFMPCGAVFLCLTVLYCAQFAGVSITVAAFIKLVIVAVILAIAAPPIPGSAFAVMPIMFTACAIPDSSYPLAVVLGTIIGYVLPALNGLLLQMELLVTGVKMDKVDREVLEKENIDE